MLQCVGSWRMTRRYTHGCELVLREKHCLPDSFPIALNLLLRSCWVLGAAGHTRAQFSKLVDRRRISVYKIRKQLVQTLTLLRVHTKLLGHEVDVRSMKPSIALSVSANVRIRT